MQQFVYRNFEAAVQRKQEEEVQELVKRIAIYQLAARQTACQRNRLQVRQWSCQVCLMKISELVIICILCPNLSASIGHGTVGASFASRVQYARR